MHELKLKAQKLFDSNYIDIIKAIFKWLSGA